MRGFRMDSPAAGVTSAGAMRPFVKILLPLVDNRHRTRGELLDVVLAIKRSPVRLGLQGSIVRFAVRT